MHFRHFALLYSDHLSDWESPLFSGDVLTRTHDGKVLEVRVDGEQHMVYGAAAVDALCYRPSSVQLADGRTLWLFSDQQQALKYRSSKSEEFRASHWLFERELESLLVAN